MNWRLLISGPGRAAWNMAVDEAILIHHGRGRVPPTLRFYRWRPAAVSIGYFQSLHDQIDLPACRALGLDRVRRPTGGRAVLHEHEVTYSVVIDQRLLPGGVIETYRRLSLGLLSGLARLGLAAELAATAATAPAGRRRTGTGACFDAPSWYELVAGGRKVAGSAQVRRRGVILQHGSIPLEFDARKLLSVLRAPRGAGPEERLAALRDRAAGLNEALGRALTADEVERALAAGFAEALGVELAEGGLTPEEEETARRLAEAKYGAAGWNGRR